MDFELLQPFWDILGILCIYSLWGALICACWASQILPFTKNLFSYGKLCHPSSTRTKPTIPTRLLTHDCMYTSHAAGFAWYYRVASFLAFYAICELILAFFAATGVQPLAYYFPVVYPSSMHVPAHLLSYAFFPVHSIFLRCVVDYISSHKASQTYISSSISPTHSSSPLSTPIPGSIYSLAHNTHHEHGLGCALDISTDINMQVDLSSQSSSSPPPPSVPSSPNATASFLSHSPSSISCSSLSPHITSFASRYFSSFLPVLLTMSPMSITSLVEYESKLRNTLSITPDIATEVFYVMCACLCVLLVCTHCFRRLYETIYVHISSSHNPCTDFRPPTQTVAKTVGKTRSPPTGQPNTTGSDTSGTDTGVCFGMRKDARDSVRNGMRCGIRAAIPHGNTTHAEHTLEISSQKVSNTVSVEQISKATSKQHILVTICGLVYYILVVLTPMFVTILLFSRLAGTMKSPSESSANYGGVEKLSALSVLLRNPGATLVFMMFHTPVWRVFILFFGIILFFFGSWYQYKAHRHLADLRCKPASPINTHTTEDLQVLSHPPTIPACASGKYKIPVEGWFTYVSCPHYLAEIIIYIGFALILPSIPLSLDINMRIERFFSHLLPFVVELMSVDSLSSYISTVMITLLQYFCAFVQFCNPMWLCVVWVTSNLYITAQGTHQWYLHTFPDYPRERSALFPSLRHVLK